MIPAGHRSFSDTVPKLQVDLQSLPSGPGVYRMLDSQGKALYVGKAKNLKHRVIQYFRNQLSDARLLQMRAQIADIQITLTPSEAEALWLEHNYIQREKPRYNILLKDDKSYPMLRLTKERHPALRLHRGPRKPGATYFGPFPSSLQAKEMLRLLAKLFRIRQCKDSIYRTRQRPCLQYDLGYCFGPCVSTEADDLVYQSAVNDLTHFLEGNTQHVLSVLMSAMQTASDEENYEKAIGFRDSIRAIQQATRRQPIQSSMQAPTDVLTTAVAYGEVCVNQLMVRRGSVVESRNHFLSGLLDVDPSHALTSFIGQFYLASWGDGIQSLYLPKTLICDPPLKEQKLIEKSFQCRSPSIQMQVLSSRASKTAHALVQLSQLNAKEGLEKSLKQAGRLQEQFQILQSSLLLPALDRVDCIDISHTQGQLTVGACITLTRKGFEKSAYRAYPLSDQVPGDDPNAIQATVLKRYTAVWQKQQMMPHVLLIDGGKAQLAAAEKAWNWISKSFPVSNDSPMTLLAIAKSVDRRPGKEIIYKSGPTQIHLPSPAFFLLQQLRDEAHRYAGKLHSQKRIRQQKQSILEEIPGIGRQKARALLAYLGGLRQLTGASIEQIAEVPGISQGLAEKVFYALHQRSAG